MFSRAKDAASSATDAGSASGTHCGRAGSFALTGGRAERPCDFPAVEGSLSATDVSARLRALYKQSRTVMQKAHGSHSPGSSNFPSTTEEVSAEAIQMFKLVEDWMNALGLEDDV